MSQNQFLSEIASNFLQNTALLRYFDLAHRGLDMAKACYALKSHASDRNEQYRGWNRGVGYGSGSTTSKWNIEDSKQEKAPIEEAVTCFIRVRSLLSMSLFNAYFR